MKSVTCRSMVKIACLVVGLFSLSGATASDVDELTTLLRDFLGAAHKEAAHRTFWAEDLVYTSSDGTRFGKSEILAGFADQEPSGQPPAVVYSATDIEVRIFGATAVVAFRLVGEPSDGSDSLQYLNTGTFLKREDRWQVVAWQATSIAKDPPGTD